jgi:hypothetical protein
VLGRVEVDYVRILDLSLGSLSDAMAFKEKRDTIIKRILNQPEETLTEIVIAGLLARDGFSLVEFDHRFRYDKNSSHSRDMDVMAHVDSREVFFEVVTKRDITKRRSSLPGFSGIDHMYLEDIRGKYAKKKIQEANELGFLSNQPIVFVVDTHRSVPHIFLNDAAKILGGCDYLTALLMFSGYRLRGDNVMLSQGNIYFIDWCKNRLSSEEQMRLSKATRNWMADAQFDLEARMESER